MRALWSSLTRPDVPQGNFGVQIKKEKTGEVKYILIPVDDFAKNVHPPVFVVANPEKYQDWKRS